VSQGKSVHAAHTTASDTQYLRPEAQEVRVVHLLASFTEVFCFFHRSIVLMATRGQPEGLVAVAPYLVSFGMTKAADLHSKG